MGIYANSWANSYKLERNRSYLETTCYFLTFGFCRKNYFIDLRVTSIKAYFRHSSMNSTSFSKYNCLDIFLIFSMELFLL